LPNLAQVSTLTRVRRSRGCPDLRQERPRRLDRAALGFALGMLSSAALSGRSPCRLAAARISRTVSTVAIHRRFGMAALDREIATYQAHLGALLDHANEYVLIKDSSILGFYPTKHEALKAGYLRFLDEAFLVRQIKPTDGTKQLSRSLLPG
jgi:hypothetical protein